jgi:hypothetical protein
VRDTPFVSEIRENLTGRTQALEDLAVELYARELSTRGIEDAFTDESGRRLLSRAAVSEITERLWAEYEAFIKRLSEYRIVYLYVDGIAERLHAGQPREAVIAVALGKHHLAKMIADPRFIVLDHLTHLDAEADHLEKRPHRLGRWPQGSAPSDGRLEGGYHKGNAKPHPKCLIFGNSARLFLDNSQSHPAAHV